MSLPIAFGLCSIAALVLGSLPVIWRISDTRRAEQRLLPKLKENAWLLQRMGTFISSPPGGETDVIELTQSLSDLVARIPSFKIAEQKAILAALQQPSLTGRRAYIGKLLEAVGQQPQAARATN